MEAWRVLEVVKDAVTSLRTLSAVTPDVLGRIEMLKGAVSDEVYDSLTTLQEATNELATNGGAGRRIPSSKAALGLYRALQLYPDSYQTLVSLDSSPSPAFAKLIADLEKLAMSTQKRLATTVEEEKGQELHFKEVCAREESVNNERLSLEQQLRSEKRERAKAEQASELSDRRTRTELEDIQTNIVQTRGRLEQEAGARSREDTTWFEEQQKILSHKIGKLENELADVQSGNRERETKLRKKKANVVEQVHTAVQEYDKELLEREKVYQVELAEYNELLGSLRDYEGKYTELREEAAREGGEVDEKKDEKKSSEKTVEEAASYIQKMWKQRQERQSSKAKSKKSGKGGKKGKK